MNNDYHTPVMLGEAVEGLNVQPWGVYVDVTFGGGGHSRAILERLGPEGRLLAFDQDADARANAIDDPRFTLIGENFRHLKNYLRLYGVRQIDGLLADLGVSSHQFDTAERGFSYQADAPLDMRFNKSSDFSAYDVVNGYSEEDLVRIFSEYGEERFSKRISKKMVEKRKIKPIKTTLELADIVVEATPFVKSKVHPATRVFQAIRIEVNHELQNIKKTLLEVFDLLEYGAIISVISFHSLEDRIVKQIFKYYSQRCHCDKTQMVCNCPPPILELVNKKPIVASDMEIKENPPSRSAKLRIAKYIKKNV